MAPDRTTDGPRRRLTGDVPWPAVTTVARTELRRRWRSLVVVGLLAGLVGAVVAATASVTWRTATAYHRLADATHLDDARVLLFSDSVTPAEVRRLPGVERTWVSQQAIGQLPGHPVAYVSLSTGPPGPPDLFTPVLLRGRPADPAAADEVVIPELAESELGLHLGDVVPISLLSASEVGQFDVGFGAPDGPRVRFKVVGVYRAARSWLGSGLGPILATPALRPVAAGSLVGHEVVVRLRHGPADVPAFRAAVDRLSQRAATGATGATFGTLMAAYPTSTPDPDEEAARHTVVYGLLLVLAVVVGAGTASVGQALARHHLAGSRDQHLEAELGMTRAERVLARALPSLLVAGVAGALSVAGGLLGGLVEPLGPVRHYEPVPGWHTEPSVLLLVAAATAAAVLLLSALTAARVVQREAQARSAGAAVLRPLPAPGRGATWLAGLALALRRPTGRTGVTWRATGLVAVLGVAGVVAVGGFAASLDRLVSTPARYGWTADFATVDARPADTAAIAADPRVTAVFVGDGGPVHLDGRPTTGVAVHPVLGRIPLTVLSGHLPRRPGQVALGLLEARALGVHLGSRVALTTYQQGHRGSTPLRVVGTLVLPPLNDNALGTGAILMPSDLRAASRTPTTASAVVRTRTPQDADAMFAALSQRLEMSRAVVPREVTNLAAVGRLPALLAGFLALLAVVVLGHSLSLTTRRQAGDLAVLRVIGMTPRQVAATVATMAGAIALAGLLVGPVLGLAVARVVWAQVAGTLGVAGDLALPWWVLLVAVPVALLATSLVAVLPARRAARLSPAQVLRAE